MKLVKEQKRQAPKIRIWDLFRRPLMRILCFNVMFSWFTVSMVFYGLALNGGSLSGKSIIDNFKFATLPYSNFTTRFYIYHFVEEKIVLKVFQFF